MAKGGASGSEGSNLTPSRAKYDIGESISGQGNFSWRQRNQLLFREPHLVPGRQPLERQPWLLENGFWLQKVPVQDFHRVVGRNVLTNILGLKVHGTKARWQYCKGIFL